MKTADVDLLIVPGWSSSGEDHWQSRWERNLKTARRVEQADWFRPDRDDWVEQIVRAVAAAHRPVVLVAHSLGVVTVAHAAPRLPQVAGAFLVAPADVDQADAWPETAGWNFKDHDGGFAPIPRNRLAFPSMVIASSNDPYCSLDRARELARCWGSTLAEAGEVGHINVASGHGPWPEGLLRLGMFLKVLHKN